MGDSFRYVKEIAQTTPDRSSELPDSRLKRGPATVDYRWVRRVRGACQDRVRLVILLGVLAGLAAYAIPRFIASGSAAAGCSLPAVPEAVQLTLPRLQRSVAKSGISSLVADGVIDAQGVQDPMAAWSDAPPPNPAEASGSARVHAGWEIRWWSAQNGHRAVDLFLFPSPADAAAYVRLSASARCRHGAVAFAVNQPAGGRALVWTNPEGYLQADVFFSHGDRAYRVVEVPPGVQGLHPVNVHTRRLVEIPQVIACWLNDASCGTLGHGATE